MNIWRSLPLPKYLLVFAPAALVVHFGHYLGPVAQFIIAAVAILGLVVVIGAATEEVAMRVGDVWGGLLNATFGNVTELIIALLALKNGSYKVVRASLTGSILGNLLLLLGLSMFAGGVRHKTQTFSRTGAAASVQMLALCLFALVIPTVADKVFYGGVHGNVQHDKLVQHLSLAVAILLLIAYGLNLVFSLWTHSFTFRSTDSAHSEEPRWSFKAAVIVLLGTVVVVALCSDVFVAALDDMIKVAKVPISEMFLGVVVVATVGNAAEGSVAVIAATKNKMELAFQVAMSSALQIALMVSPVLVIVSAIIAPNNPMTLAFSAFELLGLWAGVLISAFALNDGESNWFEGALMVIVYLAFAIVFWFHP